MSSQLATFDIIQEAPNFSWSSGDPALNGFTKHGSGTTQSDPSGWRIATLGSDAQTYYSRDNWPNKAFVNGLTLFVTPPTVKGSDGSALPNRSIVVAVDDGTNRYELTFDSKNVVLNGGTAFNHRNLPVKLVIAAGGASSSLYAGSILLASPVASIATVSAGLIFGDFATTDDSDAVWQSIAYAMSTSADGVFMLIPSLTVKIYDVDHTTLLSDLADNADGTNDGMFSTPTISAASGTLMRYGIVNYQGMSAYAEQRTQ